MTDKLGDSLLLVIAACFVLIVAGCHVHLVTVDVDGKQAAQINAPLHVPATPAPTTTQRSNLDSFLESVK